MSVWIRKLQIIYTLVLYLIVEAHVWSHDDLVSFIIHICPFDELPLGGSDVIFLEVICQQDPLLRDHKDAFCHVFISWLF